MEQNEITALTLPVIETEIRSAYAEANALAVTAKGNARAAVLRMADCGQMLMVAKDHVRGNRNEWLASLGIDPDKAAKAIHLARNRDQLELDLWPADMAKLGAQMLGILPPPGSSGREENDPERTTGASTHWLTYAGKMDLLRVSTESAKEEIGKGLVDALSLLGKNRSIEGAATQMDTFAKSISDAIYGVGLLISKLDGLASKITSGGLGDLLIRLQPGGLALQRAVGLAGGARSATQPDNKQGRASARIFGQQLRLENKLSEQKKKELALLDAKNKKQTEVDKLAQQFDVERIGLMKALNEATDADTKLRIQSKLAILDNNEALARKYNAELLAKEAADLLAEASRKAAAMLDAMPNKFDAMFTNLTALFVKGGSDLASAMSLAASSVRLSAEAAGFAAGTGRYAYPLNDIYNPSTTPTNQGTTNIDVTVNTGAVLSTNQDLTTYIQDALGNITKLGNGSLIPAGSIAFQ